MTECWSGASRTCPSRSGSPRDRSRSTAASPDWPAGRSTSTATPPSPSTQAGVPAVCDRFPRTPSGRRGWAEPGLEGDVLAPGHVLSLERSARGNGDRDDDAADHGEHSITGLGRSLLTRRAMTIHRSGPPELPRQPVTATFELAGPCARPDTLITRSPCAVVRSPVARVISPWRVCEQFRLIVAHLDHQAPR